MEGCDDQESVCSSNEREGDAFPKAFERDLVTPTNLQKSHAAESIDSAVSTAGAPATSTPTTSTTAPTTNTETTSKSSENDTKDETKSTDNNDGN